MVGYLSITPIRKINQKQKEKKEKRLISILMPHPYSAFSLLIT